MKKVTAYQCGFCRISRLYLSKSGVKKHEEKCWLNPVRKSCATCEYLYSDLSAVEANWKCLATKHIPFKKKIENCPYYTRSGGIFNDYQYEQGEG